ncbi:MAG: hypothetical protein HPY45_12630 [Anaerolineae bacterium]|nr:hypothetical protein [Anaerolineae bacterium]
MKPRREGYSGFLQTGKGWLKRLTIACWLSLFVILASALGLIWMSIPQARQKVVLRFSPPVSVALADGGEFHISLPAIARVGQPAEIWLTLQNVGLEGGQAGEAGLLIEARLDMPGGRVFPQGTVRQTLADGQRPRFVWQFIPYSKGKLPGTVWIFINAVLESGQVDRYPVLAYPLEVQVQGDFGIPVQTIRLLCILGLLCGGLTLLYQKLHNRCV